MKWKVKRGCQWSHRRTFGCLWAACTIVLAGPFNGVQEADALLVTMALHTSANAQQSTMPVIGFLGFGSPRSNTGLLTAFVKASPKRAMSKVEIEMLRSNFGGVMFYWHK